MIKDINIDEESIFNQRQFIIIAGPCAIESYEQMQCIGKFLKKLGIKYLRGGAFKPRTDPNSFQGLGMEGLKILRDIKTVYEFKVVSEIVDPRDIDLTYDYIDIYQIGSRNMQNYSLLKEVGRTNKPVLLKRGMSATIEEWIKASEYIALEGNKNIILCERGIRTFENYTRNTLDLMSVPILKSLTKYPVIVDPSHGTGRRELILPASKAALILGADGIIVEVHPKPEEALSDGFQSLNFEEFENLVVEMNRLENLVYSEE
ncbi:3-deoxy-D-arabinoheptulosonate-7-phosphate synthase [Keratinibaculum paraultunense]|uniref:3-deoxy-D-arabinoheptulosonate-7-phosphate synthase n=1 Tax=Keratinibaculum paraultunense TaxID=1278232 RepID=A0A4R3KXF0_9FIRM|nr:bifunctional 3-deoxy-7-phosphoheptulonate synthase/chorismate mutase [Keratinibaculum paraultunense]QQY78734.1 bifunctional 3-deoxy-7-phosphoheptulonate synthase/chorismate mutase [Keratinibaculum paraultunense]TCS89588.1 3-deoxy-D-arabinoheptulosonate-7-phosphate synthase [Keratinibaculum paraultunense]